MGAPDSDAKLALQEITPAAVYALLIREFARMRPPACMRCRVPLPFSGAALNNQPLWYMPTPERCPFGCNQLLVELWARITTEYRIGAAEKAVASWKGGVRIPTA